MRFIRSVCVCVCLVAAINCGEYFKIDGRSYYVSYPDARNWYQSQRYCAYNAMYLVDIRTDAENRRILSILNSTETMHKIDPRHYWTSGTDLGSEGQFYWSTTGHPVMYDYWGPAQPDNTLTAEHCLQYVDTAAHKWNDVNCDRDMYFICRDTIDIPIYKSGMCPINTNEFYFMVFIVFVLLANNRRSLLV